MTTESISAIPGVLAVLEGETVGPEIVIIAGVHGNEPCGIRAIENILPNLTVKRGRITFVLGNLRAIEQNVRFIEQNLNRLFRPDEELTETQKASYEYARSRELMPLLEAADAVLDIHSSGTKDTQPFVICSESGLPFASKLGFPLVSYGWDVLEPGGTDDYAERFGARGFCIESGYHETPEAIELATDALMCFLSLFNATDTTLSATIVPALVRATGIHKTEIGFTPSRVYRDFEPVLKGEVIGVDGGKQIAAPEDGVVIFVRERKGPNEEAFIFAHKILEPTAS